MEGDNVGSAGLSPDVLCYFSFFPFRLMLSVALSFKVRLNTEFHSLSYIFIHTDVMHLFFGEPFNPVF